MARRLAARLLPFLRTSWPDIAFLAVFVVTRLVYRGEYKIHFDGSPLFYFIQYIDPWFLEQDFWRSILHASHQAPLLNLVVGGAWMVFGDWGWLVFFELLFAGCGLLLGLTLMRVLQRVGTSRVFATILVCAFISTPAVILYENWLFYHLPVAAIFTASILALFTYYRRGTLRAGLAFFSLLTLVALIRNVYGTVWLAAIVAALLVFPPSVAPMGSTARRTMVKAAALPLLVLALVGYKSRLLIGRDPGEAGVWTNLVYKTWGSVPIAERQRLTKERLLNNTVSYEPFTTPASMPKLRVDVEPTGVPILDTPRTPSGRANTFTLEYLIIADRYYKPDGKYLIENYPEAYADSVRMALFDWYFSSPTRDIVLPQTVNYERVKKLDAAVTSLGVPEGDGRLLLLVLGLPAALLYGVYRVLRTKALLGSERTTVAMILVMLITIVYAALGTTLISSGDFSRYRFDVDPFYLVLGAMLVTDAASTLRRVYRRARA